ncbi:MAG: WD40/YVTN/BNR-like repeat-containing protein, partial [Thermoleophilaceae bacterium]
GATWTRVADVRTAVGAVTFPSRRVGYAIGGGVLRTEDGGRTWTKRPAPLRFGNSVACSDELHCVASRASTDRIFWTDDGFATLHRAAEADSADALAYSSAERVVGVGYRRTVVSDDGGRSFDRLGVRYPYGFGNTVKAATPLRAFSAWDGVELTDDGGPTWRHFASPVSVGILSAAWFFRDRSGYAAAGRRLWATRDGGVTWSRRPRLPVHARDLWSSADGHVLIAAGHRLARSTDGGRSFRPVRGTLLRFRHASWRFQQRPNDALVTYGRSSIVASDDEGAHWRKIPGPDRRRTLKRVDFPTPTVGYATTGDGRLWRTRSAGRRWREVVSLGADPRLSLLSFGDADHGWAVPRDFGDVALGWMMRTDDGGRTWHPQAVAEDRIVTGDLVATGPFGGIVESLDGPDRFFTHSGGDRPNPSSLTLTAARSRVPRGGRVRLSGVLRPARREAEIWISERGARGAHWTRVVTRTAAGGAFHVDVPVERPTYFVAQWVGYGSTAGAGSPAVLVRTTGG